MNWKFLAFGFAFVVATVSATNCWEIYQMPIGQVGYQAWLCTSSQVVGYFWSPSWSGPFSQVLHGQIQSTTPPSYGSGTYRVYLQSFTYSSPYNAVLKCYKRMGNPNSYWWLYQQTVTLPSGAYTGNSGAWVLAGCPPVKNYAHPASSPPQVQIYVDWNGYGSGGKGSR